MVTLEKKPEKRATEERIAELKQELQKAELAAAIEAAGTLNTMEATGNSPGEQLGPTVFAPIEMNGITAKALIDTGPQPRSFHWHSCSECWLEREHLTGPWNSGRKPPTRNFPVQTLH